VERVALLVVQNEHVTWAELGTAYIVYTI
jgi:hypothetical protein